MASLFIAVTLYILAGLSRANSDFLLNALRLVVIATGVLCSDKGALIPSHPSSSLPQTNPLLDPAEWPRDIRTAIQAFDLDPDTIHYACCKKCSSIYQPRSKDNPDYPDVCTFRETPGSEQCGARLLRKKSKGEGVIPIRRYVYQPMKSWLGRLLSRPDIEQSFLPKAGPVSFFKRMTDIWHGTELNEFKGPDGKWFFDSPAGEHRLAFSLFVDWFNPFGRKRGGKSATVGAIYLVCLNLPPEIRYRVENVYLVGIIPGPREPSNHHLNHLFQPLVDELLQFWEAGVFYSRTHKHKYGLLVKCVVIPVVADMVAARKLTGFMAHSGDWLCSFCKMQRKDIRNFDVDSWVRRSWEEHLEHATLWKDAATQEERDLHYSNGHIRWSELLRLPYWNPIRFTVVDTMHNFFEGEIKHHILDLWGMSSEYVTPEKKRVKPHSPQQQSECLQKVVDGVAQGSVGKVAKQRQGYIIGIAKFNDIKPAGNDGPTNQPSKKDWATSLLQWVCIKLLSFTPAIDLMIH